MESPEPTTILTGLKTRSMLASFMEKHQNIENSSFFKQKPSDSLVLTSSNWADDGNSSPTPTTITPALEKCSAFTKKLQKIENLTFQIFTPKFLEPPILACSRLLEQWGVTSMSRDPLGRFRSHVASTSGQYHHDPWSQRPAQDPFPLTCSSHFC